MVKEPVSKKHRRAPDDIEPSPVTGIVLAGGASRRMGRNKAFLTLGERSLIAIVIDQIAKVCTEVLVVASDVRPYAGIGTRLVPDHYRQVGVLGGLHAGLMAARCELALVVGCDMPFLDPALLRAFVGWAHGFDAVVLKRGEYVDPLHAAYRRACLPAITAAIRDNNRRVVSFFPHIRTRYVTAEEVAAIDPTFLSFRNVNTPADWEAVQREWLDTATAREL